MKVSITVNYHKLPLHLGSALIDYLRRKGFQRVDDEYVYEKEFSDSKEATEFKNYITSIMLNVPEIIEWLKEEFPNLEFDPISADDILDDRIVFSVSGIPEKFTINPKKSITYTTYRRLKELDYIARFPKLPLIDEKDIPEGFKLVTDMHDLSYVVKGNYYRLSLFIVVAEENSPLDEIARQITITFVNTYPNKPPKLEEVKRLVKNMFKDVFKQWRSKSNVKST